MVSKRVSRRSSTEHVYMPGKSCKGLDLAVQKGQEVVPRNAFEVLLQR